MKWLLALVLTLQLPKPILTLSKYVMQEGAWLVLSCHVPANHKNRLLRLGLEGNWRVPSEIQLDGYNSAPVYHRGYAVECGDTLAYCLILDSDARWSERATQTFYIGGCDAAAGR